MIFRSKAQFNKEALSDFKPDLVLFYGWSWLVPTDLLERHTCLMLHPSPLPRYRGGSPIQNQIIAGETYSKVTLFIMTDALDAGDIVGQSDLSLIGTIDEIFKRIEDEGVKLTRHILEDGLQREQQDHSAATFCKRRKPSESEITAEELATKPAEYLYNKIRMLADPYPNAYIIAADGKKLIITAAHIERVI
ncbi:MULTISPECIES: formyltransferase family protein [unclassified Synechococcus]|uniref:formyltransferase family protein n=1 Tax=unclassified Synechococcus TaxID=2626047 RepID=UPI0009034D34|nr:MULTISPECIES: formyltransferase family protein [unclassified Synechococcus]